MGAIIVLTPLVVASLPAIAAAVAGAAAAMGYSMSGMFELPVREAPRKTSVETEIENSEVIADELGRGEKIVLQKDGLLIEIGQDERGACTVCVTGDRQTELELRRVGEEVAGRIVQQFAYHKLMTELKSRNYSVVEENVLQDESIQVRVRL